MDENSFNGNINKEFGKVKVGGGYLKKIRGFNARVFRYQATDLMDEISERQRVTWLLDGITSTDPMVLVAKAHIKAQDGTGEDVRNRWELASVHMSQVDYAGKQKGSGRRKARMVDAEVSGVSAGGGGGGRRRNKKARLETDAAYKAMLNLKGGTGKTGVDLRYYEKSEFIKLPKNQKKELLEWRATELAKQNITLSEGGKGKKGKGGASLSSVTAIVASQFAILKDGIIDEVKGLLGSPRKPTPEEAAAAAVTAGIEAYKKATAVIQKGFRGRGMGLRLEAENDRWRCTQLLVA